MTLTCHLLAGNCFQFSMRSVHQQLVVLIQSGSDRSEQTCLTALILPVHTDTPEQVRGGALLFLCLLLLKQNVETLYLTHTPGNHTCVPVCVHRSQVEEGASCFYCGAFKV